jgi:hypothetical protein
MCKKKIQCLKKAFEGCGKVEGFNIGFLIRCLANQNCKYEMLFGNTFMLCNCPARRKKLKSMGYDTKEIMGSLELKDIQQSPIKAFQVKIK